MKRALEKGRQADGDGVGNGAAPVRMNGNATPAILNQFATMRGSVRGLQE
jgi:hypothetical protein